MIGRDLYIIQMANTGEIKVGRSKDVHKRLKQLQTGSPHRLRLILHAPGQGKREAVIHRMMRERRTRYDGEWFEEGALAELPVDLYELLNHMDDPDWWNPDVPRPTPRPEPHWFDTLVDEDVLTPQ